MPPKFTTDPDRLKDEVEMGFYRASGPGGQHRNKNETAVRIHHAASGITVRCAETRSQAENKQRAFNRLSEKLRKLNLPKKKRFKTRPTRASRERRLESKRTRGSIKRLRRKPGNEE
jgi:protein subunit release factor B